MSTPNETLYSCMPDFIAPDWTQFDAIEVQPCASNLGADGSTDCEPCEPHEAEFWTVYGHCTWGGCEAITDVSTERLARRIAADFEQSIRWADTL
jgi:hypothetical protein